MGIAVINIEFLKNDFWFQNSKFGELLADSASFKFIYLLV